jgi:hypothetical protein
VALNGGRFFTEKSTQFLYASPQRPELIIFIPFLSSPFLSSLPFQSFLYRIYPIDVFPLLAEVDVASLVFGFLVMG